MQWRVPGWLAVYRLAWLLRRQCTVPANNVESGWCECQDGARGGTERNLFHAGASAHERARTSPATHLYMRQKFSRCRGLGVVKS